MEQAGPSAAEPQRRRRSPSSCWITPVFTDKTGHFKGEIERRFP